MSASTLDDLYRSAVVRFRAAELPTPELDARWLLADVAKLSARDIVLRAHDSVSATTAIAFEASVARRLSGEPVWHTSGENVSGLLSGNYFVEFRPAFGFATPTTLGVPLANGQRW